MPAMETLTAFDRASAVATAVLDGVTDEQFGSPTPCPDWTVRSVLNHIVLGQVRAAATIDGRTHPSEKADHLGRKPRAAFADSLAVLRAKFGEPGLLERTLTTQMGERPGAVLADVRTAELLVHSWDIAVATGQDTDLDPELVEYVRTRWTALLGDRPRAMLPFAEPQPVPADASAADRLAAYLGRSVAVA
jgi:uncharacterized protein (TIGR03086 family)